ncbi:hypothetical protein BRC93_12885 [Halobacteriales archaeon QS_5_70_15]|nr:MAG: hypothetical protein BRC93_12885 [Halobacteriales archaeon QS_5_70_15]
MTIAGLYGSEGSLAAGWIAHPIHGSLFGAVSAAVLADPGLYRVTEWVWKTVVAGVVYGLVLAVVGAGIVMHIWLGVVGVSMATSIPNVSVSSSGTSSPGSCSAGWSRSSRGCNDGSGRSSGQTGAGSGPAEPTGRSRSSGRIPVFHVRRDVKRLSTRARE